MQGRTGWAEGQKTRYRDVARSGVLMMVQDRQGYKKAYLLGFGITVGCRIPGMWLRMDGGGVPVPNVEI